jgi:chromosome segregation ATPase
MTPEEISDLKILLDLWGYSDDNLVRKAVDEIESLGTEIAALRVTIEEYASREAEYITDIETRDEEIQELEERIAELEGHLEDHCATDMGQD